VGQQRILVHRGDDRRVSLARKDLAGLKGGCDVAVEIHAAAVAKGTLRLRLVHVGRVAVGGPRSRDTGCEKAVREISVAVSGFEEDVSADALEADVVKLLPTPEAYLGARGVTFESSPDDPKASLASNESTASAQERGLWRQLTATPEAVLRVDADFHDANRKVRHEGEVEFQAVVGTDGRLRDARVKGSLSEAHEAQVVRALRLWRYRPARLKDEILPARISGRLVLRIYP
jgi:hypothetical protein